MRILIPCIDLHDLRQTRAYAAEVRARSRVLREED